VYIILNIRHFKPQSSKLPSQENETGPAGGNVANIKDKK
jgi:hypothetical protein